MSKTYYIYLGNNGHKYEHIDGDVKGCCRLYDDYYLTDNAGSFFGEGNFCGYYGYSGFAGCHVIGKIKSVNMRIIEYRCIDGKHRNQFRYDSSCSVVKCDYVTDKQNPIPDRYTDPEKIEANSDEEAFELFKEYAKEKIQADVEWCNSRYEFVRVVKEIA